jgi:hypothetical protein
MPLSLDARVDMYKQKRTYKIAVSLFTKLVITYAVI